MDKVDFFPLSNQAGSVVDLNTELMHQMSESSTQITQLQFDKIVLDHKLFLESGGSGGSWQSLVVAGLTLSVYAGAKSSEGKQASFLNSNLSDVNLSFANLSYCDFTNVFCPNGRFNNANVSKSMFIDSVLANADFSGANLSGSDFSRAKMTSCRFVGANLTGCDFENCDLSFSNFQGAKTAGARFPGAILDNVIF